MKNLARILLFITAFNVNVSLKAKAGVIEFPKNCINIEGENCAIRALFNGSTVSTDSIKIELSESSTLIQKAEGYRLVSGIFNIQAFSLTKIDIKYGSVYLRSGDTALFRVEPENVHVSAVSGDIVYEILSKEKHTLPAGYTNWLSGPNEKGTGRVGIPSPIEISKFLIDLNMVTKLSKEEIIATLKKLKPFWEMAHIETNSRYLASIQETLIQEEAMRISKARELKKNELEKKKLREWFFHKTFME